MVGHNDGAADRQVRRRLRAARLLDRELATGILALIVTPEERGGTWRLDSIRRLEDWARKLGAASWCRGSSTGSGSRAHARLYERFGLKRSGLICGEVSNVYPGAARSKLMTQTPAATTILDADVDPEANIHDADSSERLG